MTAPRPATLALAALAPFALPSRSARRRRALRSAFELLALAAVAGNAAGCTSISWETDRSRYHVGLLAVREERAGESRRTDRVALGIDLDLAANGAVSLGANRASSIEPETRAVRDAQDLIATWMDFFSSSAPRPETESTGWRPFYYRQDKREPRAVTRTLLGIGWQRSGGDLSGAVGYARSVSVLDLDEDGSVFLIRGDPSPLSSGPSSGPSSARHSARYLLLALPDRGAGATPLSRGER